jgi:hypothetical protein
MAGCNLYEKYLSAAGKEFQSSPGAMAGCNAAEQQEEEERLAVSILTRRDGRVQQLMLCKYHKLLPCFNPHPARWPGAT